MVTSPPESRPAATPTTAPPSVPVRVLADGRVSRRRSVKPGRSWSLIIAGARRYPFTLTLLLLLLIIAVVGELILEPRSLRPVVATGHHALLTRGQWWTPLTSVLFTNDEVSLVFGLLVVAVLIGVSEHLMGTWRTVLAYVVTAFVGAYLGVLLQGVAGWQNQFWVGQVMQRGSLDITRPAVGAIMAASAFAGVLWRRRIRALTFMAVAMFILFSGNPPGLYRLAAALAGLVLGWVLRPRVALVRWQRSSHHEIRFLVASTVAITAIGPIIAVLTANRFGLLAPMAALATGELIPDPNDPVCNVLNVTKGCQQSFATTALQGDLAPLVVVPVLLLLLLAYRLLRGRRLALWIAVGVYGAFSAWTALYYGLLPSQMYPAATPHLNMQYWRTTVSIAASILVPAALAVALVLLRRHFAVAPEWRLLRRWRTARAGRSAPTQSVPIPALAARDLTRHGGTALTHMVTWSGNRYWFDDAAQVGIAYRQVGNVALTVGGPFGDPAGYPAAVHAFARFCDDHGHHPVFYSVDAGLESPFTAMGWSILTVAEEAVIDLPEWTLAGNRNKDVRTAVNKATRLGLEAVWTSYHALSLAQRSQLAEISEAWVADKDLPEMSFTLGGLAELNDPDVRLMLAMSAEGRIEVVTSWMPFYRDSMLAGWTLDFMRRRPDAPNGVMEFVIAGAAERAQSEGLLELSLSGVPLARASAQEPLTPLDRALDGIGRALEPHYGFHSLQRFKSKFHPRHRRLFMAYPDPSLLAEIGLALTRAYLPTLSARQAVRLLRRG